MKSHLKNYRQSPRKVRLIADLVRGKMVDDAMVTLEFTPKRASRVVSKMISSATANAEHNFKANKENLIIDEITVDKGIVLKRFRARAYGRAGRILKRTSNVSIKLKDISVKVAPKSNLAKAKADKTSPKIEKKLVTKLKTDKTTFKAKKTPSKKAVPKKVPKSKKTASKSNVAKEK